MEELNEIIKKAQEMLEKNEYVDRTFKELENFVLKNEQKLKDYPEFNELKHVVDEIAIKYGHTPLSQLRENFGLNSCAC